MKLSTLLRPAALSFVVALTAASLSCSKPAPPEGSGKKGSGDAAAPQKEAGAEIVPKGAAPVTSGPDAVSYPSGTETITGFLARPDGPGPFPALIVIHEWWGQNDWVREKARAFAREGYVALAVDLYRGESAADLDYYGRLVTDESAIQSIHAPLLGNFGAEDRGIKPDNVREFERRVKAAGKEADFKVYEGCGHAFASLPDPEVFKPAEAADADARTLAFLAAHLKKAGA